MVRLETLEMSDIQCEGSEPDIVSPLQVTSTTEATFMVKNQSFA